MSEDLCCTQNFVSDLSLASKKDHPDQRAFQIQLNLLTIIALIIYCQSLRYKVRKMNEEVAETKITPADYTVMFTEMPTDPHHELSKDEGLKKWLESMGTPENPIQVKKINPLSTKKKNPEKKVFEAFFFGFSLNSVLYFSVNLIFSSLIYKDYLLSSAKDHLFVQVQKVKF